MSPRDFGVPTPATPRPRLPVGVYVAAALADANYGGDSGEDVDRFLAALRDRGYEVVKRGRPTFDGPRVKCVCCGFGVYAHECPRSEVTFPACGGRRSHDWWTVGPDSYACDEDPA